MQMYSDKYCHSCRVVLTSMSQAEMHYKGSKHRQKLKLLEGNFSFVPFFNDVIEKLFSKELLHACNLSGFKIGSVNNRDDSFPVLQKNSQDNPSNSTFCATSWLSNVQILFHNETILMIL